MRKLFWFTAGFAGAVYLLTGSLWGKGLYLTAVFGTAAVLLGLMHRKAPWLVIPLALTVGLTAGFLQMVLLQKTYYEPFYILDGQTLGAEVLALDYGEETDYGTRVKGRVYLEGKSYDLLTYLKEPMDIAPGNTLTGRFQFRLTLPGGERESDYYPGSGILATATAKTDTILETGEEGSLRYFPRRMAHKMKTVLRLCLKEDASFAQSLLLGDSSELDYETKTALRYGFRYPLPDWFAPFVA